MQRLFRRQNGQDGSGAERRQSKTPQSALGFVVGQIFKHIDCSQTLVIWPVSNFKDQKSEVHASVYNLHSTLYKVFA